MARTGLEAEATRSIYHFCSLELKVRNLPNSPMRCNEDAQYPAGSSRLGENQTTGVAVLTLCSDFVPSSSSRKVLTPLKLMMCNIAFRLA